MSSVYSISYDLARNRDHSEFYEILQSLDAWWHYLESTWLVATDKTAEELWALVKPYVGSNDRMLIICVNEQCSGWLPDEAWDWIKENLAIESSATSLHGENVPVVPSGSSSNYGFETAPGALRIDDSAAKRETSNRTVVAK